MGAFLLLVFLLILLFSAIAQLQKQRRSKPRQQVKPAPRPAPAPQPVPDEQPEEIPQAVGKVVTYRVAGVSFHTDAIRELSYEDPDFDMTKREIIDAGLTDEKIYRLGWNVQHVELIPEDDNEHDPNAVKVMADGQLIGYIKAGRCVHVRSLLKRGSIAKIVCEIGGGPYKFIEEYEDDGKTMYNMERSTDDFWACLYITERPAG